MGRQRDKRRATKVTPASTFPEQVKFGSEQRVVIKTTKYNGTPKFNLIYNDISIGSLDTYERTAYIKISKSIGKAHGEKNEFRQSQPRSSGDSDEGSRAELWNAASAGKSHAEGSPRSRKSGRALRSYGPITRRQRDNTIFVFADDSGLSGSLNVSGRYYRIFGDMPDGGITSSREIAACVYDDAGQPLVFAHFIATRRTSGECHCIRWKHYDWLH